jgi:hypothetical protein
MVGGPHGPSSALHEDIYVYFAPRVGMNLISVPKLLRDRYSVVAHPQNVFGPWPPPVVPGNLHGRGSPAPSPVGLALEIFCSHGSVKECILRATRRDEPDQRAEVIARPLLGGGAPTKPRQLDSLSRSSAHMAPQDQ